jgi:hypothetical protein
MPDAITLERLREHAESTYWEALRGHAYMRDTGVIVRFRQVWHGDELSTAVVLLPALDHVDLDVGP